MLGNSFLCHLKANFKACSWWWNEWLLPLFTTHGKHVHVVEPRWSKCFKTYVYRFTILFHLSLLLLKKFKLPCYIVKDFATLTRTKK